MTFFEQSVFFGVSVSLAAYGIGVLLQKLEETGHDKAVSYTHLTLPTT